MFLSHTETCCQVAPFLENDVMPDCDSSSCHRTYACLPGWKFSDESSMKLVDIGHEDVVVLDSPTFRCSLGSAVIHCSQTYIVFKNSN